MLAWCMASYPQTYIQICWITMITTDDIIYLFAAQKRVALIQEFIDKVRIEYDL